jgi:SAM-dependent methyltransferase
LSGTDAKFHVTQRAALRAVPWWDRVGYIQRQLPRAIATCLDALALPADAAVLDFGCADRPYRGLLPPSVRYVGADLPGNPDADVQIRADGTLPLPDASFDAVLSTQVLEHVAHPERYLAECHRLLRPGGRLLLSTHGFMVYHPDPVDYWRWTGAGLCLQVERAGLRVLSLTGVMGLAATGLQLFQDALYGRVPGRLRKPFTALMQALIALFDRYDSGPSRALNALVFAVVAEKPAIETAASTPAAGPPC